MATRLLCAVAAMMTAGVALAPTAGGQQLSDDASLESLSVVSGVAQTKMTPAFDPEITDYFVAAPSEGDMVTVNVLPNHDRATLRWIGRDADPNLPGHQVAVTAGTTESVSVRVEAEDEETYGSFYHIRVARASNLERGWRVYDDVLFDDIVDDPRLPNHYLAGLWADEDRVFVSAFRHDPFDQKLYAFSAADSSRRPDDEFVLSGRPDSGIWSDGTTLWALDSYGTLRAYNLSDGSEIPEWSADLTPDGYYDTRDVNEPSGIWSDGDTIWVVDQDNDNAKVVAFALPKNCSPTDNYCRRPEKDFDLAAENDNPWGITARWSGDGPDRVVDTFWVTNATEDRAGENELDKKLYAYNADGSRNSDLDFDLKQLDISNLQQFYYGLAATETIMYVAEFITGRIYSFSMPGVSGAIGPALVSSDATLRTLTLEDNSSNSISYTPTFSSDHFGVYAAVVEPEVTPVKVTATPTDTVGASAVVKVGGAIVDGGVVGGTTYTSGVVPLNAEGNATTIFVQVTAQDRSNKTYTVTVYRRAKSTDATLDSLVLSAVPFEESGVPFNFDPSTYSYTPDAVANSVAQTTVTATPNSEHAKLVVINGTDVTNDNGALVIALDAQEVDDPVVNTITVEVTAEDGTTTNTYTVTVTRERLPSNIATLDMLELEDVELHRTFASDHSPYTSTVDNGVSSTVIKFKRTNQFATVAIQAVDPNAMTTVVPTEDIVPSGTPLQLAEGVNTVTVTVTSEDMTDTMDYVLTITRAEPFNDATLVSLSFNPGALSRNGASVTFDATEALYDVDVLHDDDSTELSYRKTNSTATVEIGVGGTVVQGTDGLTVTGETTLHSSDASDAPSGSVSVPLATVGSYTVTVGVTAENTTTKKFYVFTTTRPEKPADNDATLGELTVRDAESEFDVVLDPVFASGDTGKTYRAEVKHGVMSIAVHAKPSNHPVATAQLMKANEPVGDSATLASDAGQTVSLTQGTNVLTINVTAEDGSIWASVIEVVQLPPGPRTNTRLANLVLRDLSQTVMTLTQAAAPEVTEFAPEVTEYTMLVDHGVTKLEVIPSREDPNGATVEITGADPGGFVPLDVVGENTIEVVVTAEDVNFTETYTVTVTRRETPADNVATLSSLTVDGEDIGFMPETYSYTVNVLNAVDSTTVRAVATSANASLTASPGSVSVLAQAAVSLESDLVEGDNVITVVVTAESGIDTDKKTYTVTVNRAEPSPPPSNNGGGVSNRPDTSSTNTGGGSFTPIGGSNSGSNTEASDTEDDSETAQDESDTVTPLDDVDDADTDHQADINELHGLGVFVGTLCESNSLCPNDPMARWIAAVWMVRLIDGDDPEPITESRFADVNASTMWEDSMWFAPHVERLAELEITVGCTEDPLNFCPDVMLRKAQVASWLARAFDLASEESQGFVDAVGSVHEANINAVVAAGVMEGCSTDPKKFCLDDGVTKGEMASYVNKTSKAASN